MEAKADALIVKYDVATLTSIKEKSFPRTCVLSIAKADGFPHSIPCGRPLQSCFNQSFLGSMAEVMVKEVRSDFWCGQQDLNDGRAMAKQYKDEPFAFGVQSPTVPDDATPEEIQKNADDFVAEYGDCKIIICDMTPIRPELLEALYRAYRIRYSDYEY